MAISNLATLHLSRYLSTDQRSKREYVRQGNKDGSKSVFDDWAGKLLNWLSNEKNNNEN